MRDEQQVGLIWDALWRLHSKDPRWGKNLEVFRSMPTPARLHWWRQVKNQAELGVPSMRTLVAEVIRLRMTS